MRVKFKICLSGFFGSLRYQNLAAAHFTTCGAENCSAAEPKAHRRAINFKGRIMKNLALVMFSGQTHLDFVGFYDCMLRLKAVRPQFEMRFCSRERQVSDSGGLTIDAGEITTDLGGFDAVFVPGGMATRRLKDDAGFISWLATARDAKYKFSVCTGSLLLGAAGFLRGKRATTHPFCYDLLAPYCADVVHERLVRESLPAGGEIITAGGVSSSIELGLCVIEKFAGASARETAATAMDYPYYGLRGKLVR